MATSPVNALGVKAMKRFWRMSGCDASLQLTDLPVQLTFCKSLTMVLLHRSSLPHCAAGGPLLQLRCFPETDPVPFLLLWSTFMV